jgi:MFS family permease
VAPPAGGLVDRFGAARVVRAAYALAAVSAPLFWLGGHVLASLFVAATTVHAALVASHVANQTLAVTTTATPASANTIYVVSAFAGGALASALAGPAFGHWGWGGVCAVAGVCLVTGWGRPRYDGDRTVGRPSRPTVTTAPYGDRHALR